MDWYLDASDPELVSELRHEVHDYLARHADPDSDLDAAELAVAELLGNVTRHAPGPAWVTATWSGEAAMLVIRDLGPGFSLDSVARPDVWSESGRGLFLVATVTAELKTAERSAGGSRVSAVLPVRRRPERSYDPTPSLSAPLPGLDEVRPEGGFGRETFLQALVVQVAQAMEQTGGPGLAEAVVAQVGIDVGGQMEQEYRAARALVGRLTPDQLADCFVRLKHAIDGDFYVIEANEERIILGNRCCPFGEAVRRAPALCRMTSSVFGGIAARNGDEGASVVLEERIAVGDPGCRVIVYLGPPPPDAEPFSHRYAPRRDEDRRVRRADRGLPS